MQDRPDAPALLEAIGDFLMKEVLPAVKDSDSLSYKTLVSWNMLGVIAREFKDGERLLGDELHRLLMHFRENRPMPATYPEKMVLARELNEKLRAQIRESGATNENKEIWNLAKDTLREKLRVANPRFSTE